MLKELYIWPQAPVAHCGEPQIRPNAVECQGGMQLVGRGSKRGTK